MNFITVIIADDHQIFRTGLKAVLNESDFVKVIAEACNGNELLRLLHKVKPDVVLMDIRMPGMDGIQATEKIMELYPDLPVIALTSYEDISYFNQMIEAGARGFMLKSTGQDELLEAIEKVVGGEYYFSREFENFAPPHLKKSRVPVKLTGREKQVLELICQGLTNAQIAEKLGISQKTVDAHRTRLMEKTHTKNAANLVHYALKHGLIK